MRAIKPRPSFVRREIQALVRTFDAVSVTITRATWTWNSVGQKILIQSSIYTGEALIIPASGVVEQYGLGQVENLNPTMLVYGKRDIRQADEVVLEDRRYRISFQPSYFHGFMVIQMAQVEQ